MTRKAEQADEFTRTEILKLKKDLHLTWKDIGKLTHYAPVSIRDAINGNASFAKELGDKLLALLREKAGENDRQR